jgi:hypothetical protein
VEAGALAQLFAVFMGRSKVKNSKGEADKEVAREVEERCVSIISNLFQVGRAPTGSSCQGEEVLHKVQHSSMTMC